MTENIDSLKKALTENGNYDPEKAGQQVAAASSWFDSRIKRAARLMAVELIVFSVFLEIAFHGLYFATSTKGIACYAMLMVIVIVIIVNSKLHYLFSNAKMSLLKEMKILQLGNTRQSVDQISCASEKTTFNTPSLRVLKPWESVGWFAALILVASISSFTCVMIMQDRTMAVDSHLTLSADGSGSLVTKRWYHYYNLVSLKSNSLYTGKDFNITRWIDNRGRELPINVEEIGENRRYTVQLIEPVMPSQEVNDTTIIQGPGLAKQQGDIWTYQGDPQYGYEKNIYLATVSLPKGAEIISVEPKASRQFVQDGLPTIVFQATRGCNEKFKHSVKYRLPK